MKEDNSEHNNEKSIIVEKSICITLNDLSTIYEIIINDYSYFCSKYPSIAKLAKSYYRIKN